MSDALVFRCRSCTGLNRVPASRRADRPTCGACGEPLDVGNAPHDVDDEDLAKLVAKSPVPVLVDFWAAWCGPCRAVAPHLVELARSEAGRLIVAKVDVDRHKEHAARLGVQGIPTLAVYVGGQPVRVEAGARTGPALAAFVAPWMG